MLSVSVLFMWVCYILFLYGFACGDHVARESVGRCKPIWVAVCTSKLAGDVEA